MGSVNRKLVEPDGEEGLTVAGTVPSESNRTSPALSAIMSIVSAERVTWTGPVTVLGPPVGSIVRSSLL